ncbi:HflC protein [bacterium K02(2017)]|nr:HflC protein [bacterium K02(2017)]
MKKYIFGFILLAGLIVIYSSYFIVNETQHSVITRFGRPIRKPISDAGIYFKIPLIDQANFFEKRILEWDGDVSNPIPTKDKKNIIVDTTARWKITNALTFLQTVRTQAAAQTRLDDIIDSNVRDIISKHDLIEIVRNSDRVIDVIKKEGDSESYSVSQDAEELTIHIKLGRDKITREILKKAKPVISKYGIELIDVRVKGLMYSKAVLETVYNRMISTYDIKAQNLRSEGDKKKSRIDGETELELKQIESQAFKQAEIISGEADATAAKIYAEAFLVEPDFYHFQKSLEAYRDTVKAGTTLIIGTDSEYFKVLKMGDKPF